MATYNIRPGGRQYTRSDGGYYWTGWQNDGAYGTEIELDDGYIAVKCAPDADGGYGGRGWVREIRYELNIEWTGDNTVLVGGVPTEHTDIRLYLLTVDPRTLNTAQITTQAVRAAAYSVSIQGGYVNDARSGSFGNLSLPIGRDFYLVGKYEGSTVRTAIQVPYATVEVPTLGVNATTESVTAGDNVTLTFENRYGKEVALRFLCGGTTLYSATSNEDEVSVSCQRGWFQMAGRSGDAEIQIRVEASTGTIPDENALTSFALRDPGLYMEITPDTVQAGSAVNVAFAGRLGETVTLTFTGNGKTLLQKTVSADMDSIVCPRDWFDTAEIYYQNELDVYAEAVTGGSSANAKFTMRCYTLQVLSGANLTAGEHFMARVNGIQNGMEMTAQFLYGGRPFLIETFTDGEIDIPCPKAWFPTARADANKPMTVDVLFSDENGRSVGTSFTLSTPKLRLEASNENITTPGPVVFNIYELDGERADFKLLYGTKTFMSSTLYADSVTVTCQDSWFALARVTANRIMTVTARVQDGYGRSAETRINVIAGEAMRPVIESVSANIVQDSRAAFAPDTYIAGYSRVKVTAGVRSGSNARIQSVMLSYADGVEKMTLNASTGLYERITDKAISGDTRFTILVTDERGMTASRFLDVKNVHSYTEPSFEIDTLYRCDGSGMQSADGEYFKIRVNVNYDSDLTGNELTTLCVIVDETEHDLANGSAAIIPTGAGAGKFGIRVYAQDMLGGEASEEKVFVSGSGLFEQYNLLVDKYKPINDALQYIPTEIRGYTALMEAYYDAIDMELYLRSGLLPSVETSSTDAEREAAKLTAESLSPVAVANLNTCSEATAESAVLSVAKCLVRSSYQVKVADGSYSSGSHSWTGRFAVTNYGDDEDTAETESITVTISDDMETYISQKIQKAMAKESDDVTDIDALFKLDSEAFAQELNNYSLNSLIAFRQACQACLDIMVQNGVTPGGGGMGEGEGVYENLYLPYLEKAGLIESETSERQAELDIVTGTVDSDGARHPGVQTILEEERDEIQKKLDFSSFLGEELWKEFASYRREDDLTNQNYISDGLSNAELFANAEAFLDAAKREIYKSAESQHSISGDLHNILTMEEFQPILGDFSTGNWIYAGVDGTAYKLRLYSYDIDFDTNGFNVKFTDLQKGRDTASDVNSLLGNVKSLSSSYKSIARQAAVNKYDSLGSDGRSVRTESYGTRELYNYGMAEPYFGDIGSASLDENGECVVTLDPIFAETVSTSNYQVFLQSYGSGNCYVVMRSMDGFTVNGTPGLGFGWEVKAKQTGRAAERLDKAGR